MSFISSRLRLVLGSNNVARKRLLSTAANNKGGDLLINGGEFAWLREELGLQDTNIGVFNGEWAGSTASSEQVSLQLLAIAQSIIIIVNCIMI